MIIYTIPNKLKKFSARQRHKCRLKSGVKLRTKFVALQNGVPQQPIVLKISANYFLVLHIRNV